MLDNHIMRIMWPIALWSAHIIAELKQRRGENANMANEQTKRKAHPRKLRLTLLLVIVIVCCIMVMFTVSGGSIYQQIVRNGYAGTQEQWLASLVGEEAASGDAETAYELAVENGYNGSESQWIETITSTEVDSVTQSPYQVACENGFDGTLSEWLTVIADNPEKLGRSNQKGQKTEYELACEYGYSGTFIEWLVSIAHEQVFE